MQSNLRQLSPGDRFNIMTFSGIVKTWRKSMADVDDEDAMENAKDFVRSLEAKGCKYHTNSTLRCQVRHKTSQGKSKIRLHKSAV